MAHGTPKTKRHLSFTQAATTQAEAEGAGVDNEGDDAGTDRPDHIEIPNPEYITDAVFARLKKWVHNWILSRGPQSVTTISLVMSLKEVLKIYSPRFTDSQHAIQNCTAAPSRPG
jgi:hypothetical protein